MTTVGMGNVAMGPMGEADEDLGMPVAGEPELDNMGDDLGGEGLEDLGDEGLEEGDFYSLDDVLAAAEKCCPESVEALRTELESGGLEGEMPGEEPMDTAPGEFASAMGDVEPELECAGGFMESKIGEIANLITEDPDIFS